MLRCQSVRTRNVKCTLFTMALGAVVAVSHQASAQDCNEILRQGLYDHIREMGSESRASQMENEICSTYRSAGSRRATADAAASYGLFSGSLSVTYQELQDIASGMCDRSLSSTEATNLVNRSRRLVNPQAVAAWNNCNEMTSSGLQSRVTISGEMADTLVIEVSRRVQPGARERHLSIQDVQVMPPRSFSCTGTARSGVTVHDGSPATLNCTRSISSRPLTSGGRRYWAAASVISITTANGTLTVPLAAVPVRPPPPPTVLPIGSVIAFAGPAEAPPDGWLLCDGASVSRTEYGELFRAIGTAHGSGNGASTFSLPDYRGRFLRGVDGGAGRDPDRAARSVASDGGNQGDRVGSVQGDSLRSHAHSVEGVHVEAQRGGGFDGAGLDSNSTRGHPMTRGYGTSASGGSETRPLNANVVYLIRAR